MLHQALELVVVKPQFAAVEPRQVRALERHELHARHARNRRLEHGVILVEHALELVEPFSALLIARLRGHDTEHARLVVARAIERAPERGAQIRVRDEDVRQLQPCQVERLARRRADDGAFGIALAERGVRHMHMTRARKVGVDLVSDHHDVVAQADVANAAQLVFGPRASHGIVRVAQDEQLRTRFLQLALEALVVHCVAPTLVKQGARDHLAAVILDHHAERVVHRRLDDHGITRLRERGHSHGQGKHHAGGHDEPLALRAPAVTALKPPLHRLVVSVGCHRVAEHAVRRALRQRFNCGGHGLEIHVGDPKRQLVGGMAATAPRVPLQTARAATLDNRLEIVLHHANAPFTVAHKAAPGRTRPRQNARPWCFSSRDKVTLSPAPSRR